MCEASQGSADTWEHCCYGNWVVWNPIFIIWRTLAWDGRADLIVGNTDKT